jgi:tripeptide aminopeptidase
MQVSSLTALFLDAVTVDAPSLHELPMATFVRTALAGMPVQIVEDDAGTAIGGTCGNLICIPATYIPGRPTVGLFAHLDTPGPTAGVRPLLTEDRITSDGSTILGVDNRAGVSVLLDLLRNHAASPGTGNFIVVFSVAEELGMLGAKRLDLSPYNVHMGFVFDCSKRPGTFIQSAVGCSLYTALFHGRASHAGVAPEKGISAIHVAAKALSRIPMGRLAPRMTSNAGTITGGTATNVVAERCSIEGEVRSFDPRAIEDHLGFLERTFRSVADEHGARLEMQTAVDFAPFVISEEARVFSRTVGAMRGVGLEPHPIEYLGGSDANTLNEKGIPTANLGIGAQNPHGNDEFILLDDLRKTSAIGAWLIRKDSAHA